ncbi:MAG: phage terminase large subunit [Alphaproteobacteria bacterium]|nr:phage terminase large subunit [Alphaproteobacteria bacterium]
MTKASFTEFVWIWNEHQAQGTPMLHKRIARWLEARLNGHERELLLMAFRGSGKSTLVGLFCAWMLAKRPNTRILVLAADLALARKMVRNVKRIVERHPLTKGLKPKNRDQWAADQFTVVRPSELRDPSMLAKGIGANVTGSRADVVICDDVEVPNTSDSVPKRADLRLRLFELDFVLVPGGLHLYVGTPHSYYTIYAAVPRIEAGETEPFLNGFSRLELAVLDAKGRSRWPERFPLERIAKLKRRTGPNKFDSQMMLRPVNIAEGRLDPDRLRLYEAELDYSEGNGTARLLLKGKRLVSASCWWDPSFGNPEKGDASVIACIFTDEEGGYWLHRIAYLKHDPAQVSEADEATQLCRQAALFAKDLYLPAIRLEGNGIGKFLPGLLRRETKRLGLKLAVVETHSRTNKDRRIVDAFDAVLAAGALNAHRSVWATPFITEMREWRAGGKCKDDGLDAVAGCLLAEPVRLNQAATAPLQHQKQDWRPGAPIKAGNDFEL